MLPPAFITALSAVASTAPTTTTTHRHHCTTLRTPPTAVATPQRPSHAPPKRVRVSDLTRKYRSEDFQDEDLLVGISDADLHRAATKTDAPPDQYSASRSSSSSSDNSSSSSSTTASRRSSSRRTSNKSASLASPSQSSHVSSYIDQTTANLRATPPSPSHNVRLSRFPCSWNEAVSQACDAASSAAIAGFDRLRVDLRGVPAAQHPTFLLDAAATLATRLIAFSTSLSERQRLMFGPRGVVVLCDTPAQVALLTPRLAGMDVPARAALLGEEPIAALFDMLVVVVAPTNRNGRPERIELVEQVHYSNWNHLNWVVLLNPDLISLSGVPGPDGQPRSPCFMGDYCMSYYIDPTAFPSRVATGALLRSYPRKWEMYLHKGSSNHSAFRLVAEQKNRPSDELMQCEFSWRVEREMNAQTEASTQLVG